MTTQKSRVILQLSSADQKINIRPNLQYKRVQVEQLSIPHIWYPIPSGTIIFHDSLNVSHTINIPNSASDVITFMNDIKSQLNGLDTGGATYTYAINTSYYTISISSSAAQFGFVASRNLALKLGLSTLSIVNPGFYGSDFGSGSTITTGRINFTTQQIFINFSISVVGQGTSFDNLSQPQSSPLNDTNNSSYMFNFPVSSMPGEIETMYLGDYSITYSLTQGQQSLHIRVTDEYGNLIDVRPQSMYITLIYEC